MQTRKRKLLECLQGYQTFDRSMIIANSVKKYLVVIIEDIFLFHILKL